MFDIYVERVINKDINAVFELLADHGGLKNFNGVKDSAVLEEGDAEKNGLGALRYVDLGVVNFDERITHFERPHRLDYLIERSSPLPFNHQQGSITLEEHDGGTKVVWISKGTISIPIAGTLVFDKVFESKGKQGFGSLLKQIAQL